MSRSTMKTLYFVVPAPGNFQGSTKVLSSHRTISAALKAAGPGFEVRIGSKRKGDWFFEGTDRIYPRAER